MLFGTIVSGLGFGAVFSGTLRTILPLVKADERAGLLSAFYLEVAFSLPTVLTGFVAPVVGLPLAADVYGAAVILLAVASLVAIRVARGSSVPTSSGRIRTTPAQDRRPA